MLKIKGVDEMKYYIDFYDNTYKTTRKYILHIDENINEKILKSIIAGIVAGFDLGSKFGDNEPDYLSFTELSVSEKVEYLKIGLRKAFSTDSIDIYKESDEIFNSGIIL